MTNLPCPFCGGTVDPEGWLVRLDNASTERGPECEGCGATAPDLATWNRRTGSAIQTLATLAGTVKAPLAELSDADLLTEWEKHNTYIVETMGWGGAITAHNEARWECQSEMRRRGMAIPE